MKTYLRVLEAVEAAGVRAWLVGDPVREIVMGIYPSNLTVVAEPCDLKLLAASLGGELTGAENYPLIRTSMLGTKVEVTCMENAEIQNELSRRDFSMNAIAIRSDGVFTDPYNGRQDIRNRLVRLTGDDIGLVHSDPIRIVRMLRFAAELEMNVFWKSETDVRSFIEQTPNLISNIPSERWGREIQNAMRRRPHDFICLCDRYRLLPFFLSTLEELKDIPTESGQSLFAHTLDTLRIVQDFLSQRKPRENDSVLSFAALFHHAGAQLGQPLDTPKTASIASFYLRSWNIQTEIIQKVENVIKNYRLPYLPMTEEELCRAALQHGLDVLEMVLDFAVCNSQADKMKNMDILAVNKWRLGEILRRYEETSYKTNGNPRYLTGNEIMDLLKMPPGKTVGGMLSELEVAVGIGQVSSKVEATEWVLKHASA